MLVLVLLLLQPTTNVAAARKREGNIATRLEGRAAREDGHQARNIISYKRVSLSRSRYCESKYNYYTCDVVPF